MNYGYCTIFVCDWWWLLADCNLDRPACLIIRLLFGFVFYFFYQFFYQYFWWYMPFWYIFSCIFYGRIYNLVWFIFSWTYSYLVGLLRWYSCMNHTCPFYLSAVSRILTSFCTPPYSAFWRSFSVNPTFNTFYLNMNEIFDTSRSCVVIVTGRSPWKSFWRLANMTQPSGQIKQ